MTDKLKKNGSQRLAKVSGQVIALRRFVAEDRPCLEILQQIASARAALEQVSILFLTEHLQSCVLQQGEKPAHGCCDDLTESEQEDEIKIALKRFLRS